MKKASWLATCPASIRCARFGIVQVVATLAIAATSMEVRGDMLAANWVKRLIILKQKRYSQQI